METECPPVTVKGDWDPSQSKTVKNKLQLYFQSRKKSGGGDCRVEVEDGAPRAAVYFKRQDVRDNVLAKENHEITLGNQSVRLRLSSAASPTNSNSVSDSTTKSLKSEVEPGEEPAAASADGPESIQSAAVVLGNLQENMSRDLLLMLVENVSGVEESDYSLEIIWESNRAVVTFNKPADALRFLSLSETSPKLQKYGLTARLLEAAKSVRVENLPPTVVKDLLELYFEKSWALPDKIVLIPEEQAAIVTFSDPKVVESICRKEDHVLRSTHVTVYPYLESLGTTLYGKERPTWKMPEPFTERLHPAVWKFLLMKKLLQSINDQMRPYFCSVDLDNPDVKLSPLPSFLRQKGLTVDKWMGTAQEAFRQQISQYSAFECPASAAAWKAAERDLQSVVKECAVLVLDASRGMLSVAGRANDIKQIRAPVENIVLKAMSQIERQTNSISEVTIWAPAMFYILKQDGLQSAASSISPDMSLSYNEGTQSLTITGLPAEVYKIKAWMLERNMRMSRKLLNVPPSLLDFLKTVDAMDMSQDLFTSQGISAIYSTDSKGVLLLGSSDSVLSDAENKMKMVLAVQTVDVEDQEVLKLDTWASLSRQLMDTYNSSKKKTVSVQIHPEQRDKVLVAGFMNPVREISRSLKEFVVNYSRVQETIRVKSCAVVQFIDREKSNAWTGIAKANSVTVQFDSERPRIFIHGAHLHVQKAKSCFQELISALCTDTLTVDKPGAKKYFMSQGRLLLSTIMMEFSCVVVLCPENQEEEEEDSYEEESGLCFCKVQTASGVLVSVSKADICGFGVDAVVNAANEDLQHIGGLALALLKAAGPQLQKISNDYIAVNGKLRPGDAIVTGACNLPCKYVIHAVGPRFTDSDKKTSVARLKLAVKESLKQAAKTNCSTIALPAISSGVFGFPVDLCAETIAEAVREYCDSPEGPGSLTEIHLVDNNDNTVRVLATAVNQQFSDLRPTMAVPQPAGGRGAAASGGNTWSRGQSPSPRGRGGGGGRKGGGFRGGQQVNRGGQSPRGHTGPGEAGGPGWMEQTTAEGLKIVLCQGNIQEQRTDVIVNTISETMNLNQGAVSKAILEAAGPALQSTVRSGAKTTVLQYGDVVVTSGFKLSCRKVFHAVCPFWDNGTGKAEEELTSIIRFCLEEAEKLKMASLSFPPIGTGNLSFPKDLVSRVLLTEIHSFSRRKAPRHLKEVAIVVHPSSSQTVDCFIREFRGQTAQRNVQPEPQDFKEPPVWQTSSQSQQPSASASIGPVLSPSLGIHQMQMGALTLEVSSGDITKESSDVIVNSSNPDFTLKSGVSKAILDGAGSAVEEECSQIVNSPGYQSSPMIMTSAGKLPSKNILHVVGQNDPAKINEMVLRVLNVCEDNKFSSVSLPALGTGQGGASPSAVADAMVGAVVEFVRKKQPRFVRSVKILIFQTAMTTEFHRSMRSRQGQEVEEKSVFTKFKESVTSFFTGPGEERPNSGTSGLEEEFESIVFQLCADNNKAVSQAKRKILDLIVAEQAKRTIRDQYISELSPDDVDQLQALQRELTISLRLDKGLGGQEPSIQLEGLTRDVFTAEAAVRDILRRVERLENLRSKALLLVGRVEWQFCHSSGVMFPFDMYANLQLEEALEKKQSVRIKINDEMYRADVMLRRAVSENRRNEVELLRKDLKDDAALPPHWEDMKGALLKLFPVAAGSKEYDEVKTELTKTSLTPNIISIERVQNATLWQNYQLMKKQMEVKNKHTNNEKLLFHGTGAGSIDLINTKGFNRGYAGTNGAMFGNGSYFAVDPAYSVGYANPDAKGHKRMYLTRVLAGDFTQGKAGMITPPSRGSGNAADLYDSVTDKTANPTMFVVFNDIQAYPEYLITFT
ncbi:protein mono-ADP-ribosyltransferase PARP14-like isoform X2 [Mastacembelus armatus]|uniref:protein mono-ADP-ribosyltransferase PARP14-like isoform X2 n=1 Tax=Mastacembelus armatus TaxID=205130 RepID=UPI000E45837A|nr:protein mono-ADP-ribosyltransferase PARP14-like isoform X2 [Mastacembelus armatus]